MELSVHGTDRGRTLFFHAMNVTFISEHNQAETCIPSPAHTIDRFEASVPSSTAESKPIQFCVISAGCWASSNVCGSIKANAEKGVWRRALCGKYQAVVWAF